MCRYSAVEFPCINPRHTGREYRYTYMAAASVKDDVRWGPNQCLVKFDAAEVGPGKGGAS